MMKLKLPALLFSFLCSTYLCFAQPGTLDLTFSIGTGFNDRVGAIAIQPDGKIIVCGDFTSYNGTTANHIIRLNADGSVDNTFNAIDGFSGNGTTGITAIVIQPDGKIIVGGCFNTYNGLARNSIARINADGSIDNTFNIGTGFFHTTLGQGCVYDLTLQADGKIIVVGGQMNMYNGSVIHNVVRLNTNGSLDNTFVQGSGFATAAFSVTIQNDQKILVGGILDTYNGTAVDNITRLNADGSIDNTFSTTGTGFNSSVFSMIETPDNKIIAGGLLTEYNGISRGGIAMIEADGSLSNSMVPEGTGFDDASYKLYRQPDGKIIASGYFLDYNGTALGRITRLNADGSLDNLFNTGTGFNNFIRAMAVQSDGKIIAGGWFTDYNGTTQNYIARINDEPGSPSAIIQPASEQVKISGFGSRIAIDASGLKEQAVLSVYTIEGKEIISRVIEPNWVFSLTLPELASGIITVTITNQIYSTSQKLFITKP